MDGSLYSACVERGSYLTHLLILGSCKGTSNFTLPSGGCGTLDDRNPELRENGRELILLPDWLSSMNSTLSAFWEQDRVVPNDKIKFSYIMEKKDKIYWEEHWHMEISQKWPFTIENKLNGSLQRWNSTLSIEHIFLLCINIHKDSQLGRKS